MQHLPKSSQQSCEEGSVINPISQMGKLKIHETVTCPRSHFKLRLNPVQRNITVSTLYLYALSLSLAMAGFLTSWLVNAPPAEVKLSLSGFGQFKTTLWTLVFLICKVGAETFAIQICSED